MTPEAKALADALDYRIVFVDAARASSIRNSPGFVPVHQYVNLSHMRFEIGSISGRRYVVSPYVR